MVFIWADTPAYIQKKLRFLDVCVHFWAARAFAKTLKLETSKYDTKSI